MSTKKKKGRKPSTAQAGKENRKTAVKTTNAEKEAKMSNTNKQAERMTADAAVFTKEQMDALMQSGSLWMKGAEDILKTCVSLTQDAVEKNTEAVKCLMGCRTLNELTETQTRLVQESFDDLMANAGKISEMTVRVATDSFEPINAQLNKTLRKTTEKAAA